MKIFISALLACTITAAIKDVRPGAEWLLQGDSYEGLTWLDQTQTKPSEKELAQATSACEAEEEAKPNLVSEAKDTLKSPEERLDALIQLLKL